MTVEEIRTQLDELDISYHIFGYDKNQYISILSCSLGDNFFDYGEEEPDEFDWDEKIPVELIEALLKTDLVDIVKCYDCCGCAGW